MKIIINLLSLILILFLATTILVSQNIKGIVIDEESKKQLDFVHIGVVGKNTGVLSDENGSFKLQTKNIAESDSIIISYLGYDTKQLTLVDLKKSLPKIKLRRQVYELPKLNLEAKALTKEKKLGYPKTNSKRIVTGWSIDTAKIIDNPLGERGTIIKLKDKSAFIKNVNFHLVNHEYDSIICRIHIYNIKDGLPNKELTKENIFVRTTKKQGWIKVPIDHLQLIVDEDIIVTVEWVNAWKKESISGEGLHFSLGFFGKLIWREYAHKPNWQVNNKYRMGIYLDVKTN